MTRITLTLLRKELHQHWLPFALLALLCVLTLAGLVTWLAVAAQVASVFEPVRIFLMLGVPLVAAITCGHLVVAEYRAKTQLFLEALPVTRLHMVLVKFGFGLAALLAMVLTTLALAAVFGKRHEAMTPQFAVNLATSAAAHAFFWFTFFFTTGLLGRYRWPLLLLLGVALYTVDTRTAWDFSEFGPFKLIGDRFAFEREALPTRALTETLLTALALAAAGFALALVREGGVSALLAEKMSQREKVFVCVVVVTASVALTSGSPKAKRQPYNLPDAVVQTVRGVTVKVAGPAARARPLAEFLAGEMADLREYLALDTLPTVMITRRSDLDANKFERGQISNAEGFLVRLNYDAEGFDRGKFTAWLATEIVNHRLHGRASREDRRWVLDGFGEFWQRRARRAAPLAEDKDLALRALVGCGETGVNAATLARWMIECERVGDPVGIGMSWSGLRTLAHLVGPDACRDFLRAVLGQRLPQDVRALFRDRTGTAKILRRTAGITEAELLAAWNRELAATRAALAAELAQVPRPTLDLRFINATPATVLVRYQANFSPPARPVAKPVNVTTGLPARIGVAGFNPVGKGESPMEYRLRYLELPPLDEGIDEDTLKDELHRESVEAIREHELPASFPRGGRLLIGVAVNVPALGCDVISGWQRLTIGGAQP